MFDDIVKYESLTGPALMKEVCEKLGVEYIDDELMCEGDDSITFADARALMAEYFDTDDDLRASYQANIAMFLNDKCDITDHKERNKLAWKLMKLLWG